MCVWTANEDVGGGGVDAFKRMFSKIDAKPTLQIKQNLKHDLSFLNKYVNSRRRVPEKVLVQSIRLLKPGEKKKTCPYMCQQSGPSQKPIQIQAKTERRRQSAVCTHPVNDPGEFNRRTKRC